MARNWNYDVFAVVIILVIIYFAKRYLEKEGFNTNNIELFASGLSCTFMTASETSAFIMGDPDGYTHSLTEWDLIARKATTEFEYRRAAAQAAINFTEEQRSRFRRAAQRADSFFAKYAKTCTEIDLSNIVSIPWVFALTRGQEYEDGLSHTRANVIFVADLINETPTKLYEVLVHEKVHLFQRLYAELVDQYIIKKRYKRWKYRVGEPRIRANPDLNPWIYIEPTTESPMLSVYASDKPQNISDVLVKYGKYEHPYEEMSYMIQSAAATKR
jgi:hypothetical protein